VRREKEEIALLAAGEERKRKWRRRLYLMNISNEKREKKILIFRTSLDSIFK
jgi:hypothetical protein